MKRRVMAIINSMLFAGRVTDRQISQCCCRDSVPDYVDQAVEQAIGRGNEARQLIRSYSGAGAHLAEAITSEYKAFE